MTTLVRPALLADAASLLDLIRQHAAFERGVARLSKADLAHILTARQAPTHLMVAQEDAELVGYAALTFDYALWSADRFAHLDCLFVCSAARGRGIGKRLFEQICLTARQAGVRRIEWQTPVWNAEAIRFYEREGGIGQPKMRFGKSLPAHAQHDVLVVPPAIPVSSSVPPQHDQRWDDNQSAAE